MPEPAADLTVALAADLALGLPTARFPGHRACAGSCCRGPTGGRSRRSSPAARSDPGPRRACRGVPARRHRVAVATFGVNIVAAFLLGYFVTRLQERLPLSSYRRPLLGTGICGGLSTFSTMEVEILKMLSAHAYGLAAGYAAAASRRVTRRSTCRPRWCAGYACGDERGGLGRGRADRGGGLRAAVLRGRHRHLCGRARLPVRHAGGQPVRRGHPRTDHRARPDRGRGAARGHGRSRLLHDILDLDAGNTTAD